MAKKEGNKENILGAWAFLIGVILAVVMGLFQSVGQTAWVSTTMVIIGLLVGLLNIGARESRTFLLSGVSLVIVSFMGSAVLEVIQPVSNILSALLILFVPATIVVALRSVFVMARD